MGCWNGTCNISNMPIFEGDKVIVRKTNIARDGDIVIAYIDDGYTLKTYRNKNGKVWLEPANSNYPNLYPKQQLIIFGVAQVRNKEFMVFHESISADIAFFVEIW